MCFSSEFPESSIRERLPAYLGSMLSHTGVLMPSNPDSTVAIYTGTFSYCTVFLLEILNKILYRTTHVSAEMLERLKPSSALWHSDVACAFLTFSSPD